MKHNRISNADDAARRTTNWKVPKILGGWAGQQQQEREREKASVRKGNAKLIRK